MHHREGRKGLCACATVVLFPYLMLRRPYLQQTTCSGETGGVSDLHLWASKLLWDMNEYIAKESGRVAYLCGMTLWSEHVGCCVSTMPNSTRQHRSMVSTWMDVDAFCESEFLFERISQDNNQLLRVVLCGRLYCYDGSIPFHLWFLIDMDVGGMEYVVIDDYMLRGTTGAQNREQEEEGIDRNVCSPQNDESEGATEVNGWKVGKGEFV